MPRLDAYHFYEREWDSFEQLQDAFEWEVPDQFNIAEYVCDRWTEERGRVALFADDEDGRERTYTFRDLQLSANRLANYLSAAGVGNGDRIGICLGQRPEAAVAHLAAWKLGAVSVPLSTQFGEDALGYRLDDCSASACVVGPASVDTLRGLRDDLSALETVLTVDVDATPDETAWSGDVADASRHFETVETDAEDDAIIIYTSGTTGQPKGVLHAHRFLLGHLPLFGQYFLEQGTTSGTVFWTPVEWSWIGSLFSTVMSALFYGRPVVAYDAERFDAEAAFELIDRRGITNLSAPPTALRMMMQVDDPTERYDLETVQSVGAGGEAVGESLVEWVKATFGGADFEEAYGQTEANLLVGDCTALADRRPGKMGLAAPGHELWSTGTSPNRPTRRSRTAGC
jgi:acetyl-CoA synthetase